MPAYLKKARSNIETAELLIDNGLALSSAHSAYYSSFLMIKYMLNHFFSLSYAQQNEISNGKDSHKTLSNTALLRMAAQDIETGNDYLVWYNKLNKMRRKADYLPDPIDALQLRENLLYAQFFLNSVDKHFINVVK